MGRWACFGLRGLRYRTSKGKRWSLERAEMEGRNMAKRFLSDMSWHGFTDFKQECVTSWTKLFATNEVQFTDNAIDNSKMQDITDVVRILRNFS